MQKIPTLFLRDPSNMRRVINTVHPKCQWVIDGEGMATRKYEGVCVLLDNRGWWSRREVKPDRIQPPNFITIDKDANTGKTIGWEPIDQSPFSRVWMEAVTNDPRYEGLYGGYESGTYELCGPRIKGNPEKVSQPFLVRHIDSPIIACAPRDFDGLAKFLVEYDGKGVVWHHPDGRMAKLKRRDMQ